jgi:hypothetical protein
MYARTKLFSRQTKTWGKRWHCDGPMVPGVKHIPVVSHTLPHAGI